MAKDDEYAEFVHARWLTLVRTALSLGCSLVEAEDLAQTTMLRVYVSWSKVARAEHRDAYVSKMLLNAHRESHRKRRWRESLTAEPPETALPVGEDSLHSADAIRRAVSHLSQGQREVVALRFYMGLTEPEIAASLNIARGTVKSRLSRALSALSADTTLIELRDGGAS